MKIFKVLDILSIELRALVGVINSSKFGFCIVYV